MPGQHRLGLNDMEHRSPAVPSLRQPGPQHTINCREAKTWVARSIHDSQLVSERDDFQVQRRA